MMYISYRKGGAFMSNIGNKKTMSENLQYYIKRSGRTQREISEVVGVAPSTFNEWVKGNKYPRIDKIEILANYFGILKSDLIEDRLNNESHKKNDIAADIVIRLGSDLEFCECVKLLCKLDSNQIKSVKNMLSCLI